MHFLYLEAIRVTTKVPHDITMIKIGIYKSRIHDDSTLRAQVFNNSSQCISLTSGTYT